MLSYADESGPLPSCLADKRNKLHEAHRAIAPLIPPQGFAENALFGIMKPSDHSQEALGRWGFIETNYPIQKSETRIQATERLEF
jgi:hypothetical protein